MADQILTRTTSGYKRKNMKSLFSNVIFLPYNFDYANQKCRKRYLKIELIRAPGRSDVYQISCLTRGAAVYEKWIAPVRALSLWRIYFMAQLTKIATPHVYFKFEQVSHPPWSISSSFFSKLMIISFFYRLFFKSSSLNNLTLFCLRTHSYC